VPSWKRHAQDAAAGAEPILSIEHVRAALAKINLPPSAAEKSLQAYADELLLAAQRGELADAYAACTRPRTRPDQPRHLLAHDNQAKAARGWHSRLTLREKIDPVRLHPGQQ